MKDFIPLGTGNSRYLKSVENFKTLYPTYDAFVAALVAGTLPIDLNGINEAGVAQWGTPLNKLSLLSDETAALFGLGADAVPDDALIAIKTALDGKPKIVYGSYVGTGSYGQGNENELTFDFTPKFLILQKGNSFGSRNGWQYLPGGYAGSTVFWIWGLTTYSNGGSSNSQDITTIFYSGNTVSWRANYAPDTQFNASGETYHYFAIG